MIGGLYKFKQDKKHHHKVMATVTDSVYGEGTYQMLRRSGSKTASANSNIAPAQVNVTLNSPLQNTVPPPSPANHPIEGSGTMNSHEVPIQGCPMHGMH